MLGRGWRKRVNWPVGIRHRDGMNSVWAGEWNVGDWLVMLKEKHEAEEQISVKILKGKSESDQFIVAKKLKKKEWSEGAELFS